MTLSGRDFERLVLQECPSLHEDFVGWEGLLHLQVMEFAIFTEKAASAGRNSTVQTCLRLADLFFREGDQEVLNAMHVSFLEALPRQGDVHLMLRGAMSPALVQGWDDILASLAAAKANDNC
jgi:hypothetical protein